MAHCSPCKSKLGTGFVPSMMKRASKAHALIGSGAPMTAIALAESGGSRSPKMTVALRNLWVPASATRQLDAPLWATYTGGKRARLHIGGLSQVRRVISVRNGGPTGLEVRLGRPVVEFGSGGCGKPKQGMGMGTGCGLGTGAEKPTHVQWAGSTGPYAGPRHSSYGRSYTAGPVYDAADLGEEAVTSYYAIGTAGARNEELALAASAGPRHRRRR